MIPESDGLTHSHGVRPFQFLYSSARVATGLLFVAGLIGLSWPQLLPGTLTVDTILVAGMAILGLTPIFGLAIIGSSWLRTRLTDAVGWMAWFLVVLTAWLWMGFDL